MDMADLVFGGMDCAAGVVVGMKRLLATLLLSIAAVASANTLVNTGSNPYGALYSVNWQQSLGVSFGMGEAETITNIDGYFDSENWADLTVSIYTEFPGSGSLIYQASTYIPPFQRGWFGIADSLWLPPGLYTVVFSSASDSGLAMPGQSPIPQAFDWYQLSGSWYEAYGAGLSLFVGTQNTLDQLVVSTPPPVPEPPTLQLIAAGLSLIGLAKRKTKW
jgi:hypothetical protein